MAIRSTVDVSVVILDTNILSALMQQTPDPAVIGWLDAQAAEMLWITSITLFEARYGIALLPAGQRRTDLQGRLDALVRDDLCGRILPFESRAAACAADLAAQRQRKGRPVDMRDTLIAGIAIARGAALFTRNIKHFDDLPVPLISPDFSAD